MPKKLTQEEFERKIKEIHGNNINISNVKYVNSWTYIHCKCNICGNEWNVKPNTLFNGHGCRKCYDNKNSENRKQNIDDVNKRIKEKGNNTEVIGEFIDTKHNVLVRCNTCGYEWRTKPILLYKSKNGCPNCGRLSMTNEDFIKLCQERYNDVYDFSETVFKGKTNKVTVRCKKDNKYFEVKAISLLTKTKKELCPFCKEEHRLKKEQEILIKKLKIEELRNYRERNKKIKITKPRGYNTETFIKRLKTVIYPNEDYDYSKTVFNGLRELVTCHCNKHNIDFTKDAYSLLVGRGCHLCKRTGHKFTTEEWKILAKEKYPDFDYNNVDYINKSTKVKICCHKKDKNGNEHGIFEVLPNRFLSGNEKCQKCEKERILKEKESKFLKKLKEIYQNYNYDFSEVEFKNTATKIKIKCNIHNNVFYPTPNNILRHKSICPMCAIEQQKEKSRLTYDNIVKRLNEIHPTLDFSLFKEQPENTNEKIEFICHKKDEKGNEHGKFTKTLHNLLSGQGCPVCGRIQAGLKMRLTQNEFINRVKEVHKLKNWDLSKCVYNKDTEEVTVICNESDSNGVKHGKFKIKAVNLLIGNGCPKCSTSHLEQKVRVFFNDKVKLEGQKRFDWLGMQSLDFYSDDYKIGIECQGSQHFEANFFISKGIEYANKLLKEVQERDTRKKQLCKENGIKLIYFLDKNFEKYMKDDDIYFTDLQQMLEYIIKQPQK